MRNSHHAQREAREFADRHDTGYDARARELRAENARRAAAATRKLAAPADPRESVEFMRSIMSTPYAEVRS